MKGLKFEIKRYVHFVKKFCAIFVETGHSKFMIFYMVVEGSKRHLVSIMSHLLNPNFVLVCAYTLCLQ